MALKRIREEAEAETMPTANFLMLLSRVGETSNEATTTYSFECKTCNKRFHSFQALGGHRASHKKLKLMADLLTQPNHGFSSSKPKKKHECSICGLEFALGQALGGHMRRHRAAMDEGREFIEKSAVHKMVPVLKRSNSKRVWGLDLSLTIAAN